MWHASLEIDENRKKVERIQRLRALRVTSAYRTTSGEAEMVLAGMMPFTLVAEQAAILRAAKIAKSSATATIRGTQSQFVAKWQERWKSSDKGRWTYRMIPNIQMLLDRKHGEVNYDLTQFLTGHGGYRSYLHRFGHDDSPFCPLCKSEVENPEHAIFHCPRFERERTKMQVNSSVRLTPDNVVDEK